MLTYSFPHLMLGKTAPQNNCPLAKKHLMKVALFEHSKDCMFMQ